MSGVAGAPRNVERKPRRETRRQRMARERQDISGMVFVLALIGAALAV
jgi:hypothetical protein